MTTGWGGQEAWACEIGRGCRSCDGDLHLSVPCSLAAEAHAILTFLGKDWREDEFPLFFRLYLVMLSEFIRNLQEVAGLMRITVGIKPPEFLSSWCNNFAKHRVAILIQHHPPCIIADRYGGSWSQFEASLPNVAIIDACGTVRPVELIGRGWFGAERKKDIAGANDHKQAVVVIPPIDGILVADDQILPQLR